MSLDLTRLSPQIQALARAFKTHVTQHSQRLKTALETLQRSDPSYLKSKVIDSAPTCTFLLASVEDSVAGRYPPSELPKDYTVIAVDGSHIDVDRHSPPSCFLINIGSATIRYGSEPWAHLASYPRLYTQEDELLLQSPDTNDERPIEGALLGAVRAVEEVKALASLAQEMPGREPLLALADGSLILWGLTSREYPDFVRDRLLTQELLPALDTLRGVGQRRPLALAGYVSFPRFTDVVNTLRLRLCPYEPANCDLHCAHLKKGARPCDGVHGLQDQHLLGVHLSRGQRSDTFFSRSRVVLDYYGAHQIAYFYLHAGDEIARLEVPQWVAQNPALLHLTHTLVLDQAHRGHGYPVAIAEANEQAVLGTAERQEFRLLLEQALVQEGLPADHSRKSTSKLLRWL